MRRHHLFILGAILALIVGVSTAWAVGETTGTVSACATSPAQTIAVNGAPVTTVQGATGCTTVTYTVPTVTQTVTLESTTTTAGGGSTPVPVGAELFGDEFNGAAGSEPSSTLWGAKTSHAGSGLAQWQGWANVDEDGSGDLAITAVQDGSSWDSAFISGKVAYGGPRYVEARANVPCGYGTWAAPVWEWDAPYGAGGLEVDESEFLGRTPNANNVHLHNWTVSPQASTGGPVDTGSALCGSFHTYGAAVYSDHVDFYVDGVKDDTLEASAIGLSSLTSSSLEDVANIDLNMGGSWAGTPTVSGPVTMLVDFLHVYALA